MGSLQNVENRLINQETALLAKGKNRVSIILGVFLLIALVVLIVILVGKNSSTNAIVKIIDSNSINKLHTVTLEQEVWPGYFDESPDGTCQGSGRVLSNATQNYNFGSNVVLIGPSGEELAASTFSHGTLKPTAADLTGISFSAPTGNICSFTAVFKDVPEVATYRVKSADGDSSGASTSLSDLKDTDWTLFLIFKKI